MDAPLIALWFCAGVSIAALATLAAWLRGRVLRGQTPLRRAQWLFTFACPASGALCGGGLLLLVTRVFGIAVGHGDVFSGSVMLHALLTVVAVVGGRLYIDWTPIRW